MIDRSILGQFCGTSGYHRWSYLFRNMVLTDGAKYVADHGGGNGAYWLMDLIASYQPQLRKHEKLRDIQFWEFKVTEGAGVVTCRVDSGCKPSVQQEIPYTDFDLDEISLWVERADENLWVILLPSEH